MFWTDNRACVCVCVGGGGVMDGWLRGYTGWTLVIIHKSKIKLVSNTWMTLHTDANVQLIQIALYMQILIFITGIYE